MRWLYDQKVKTYTDKYLRELFHCAECKSLGKSYAFEGMIQHYGAKHTTEFSRGNIVVHWQSAEWPDECPLEPCNGATPNPALPPKPPTKAPEAGDTGHNQLLDNHNGPAQSAYSSNQNGPYDQSGHPAYPPDAHTSHAPYGYPYATATLADPHQHVYYPPPVNPRNLYQDQVDFLANLAREIWDTIAGIQGLEESVRVHTVLHHVVSRFKAHFGGEPTLDMLADALFNHELMRPIKDAGEMACMTCISSNLDGFVAFKPYAKRIADYKLYNTSSLITHFKTVHLGSDSGLDWKEDMIELPEDDNIRQLLIAIGMNDEKLGLIAAVFPKLFPNPLPRIGEVKESFKPLPKKDTKGSSANKKKSKKQKRNSGHHPAPLIPGETSEEQSDAIPEAADDEYDPRRPAFIERGNQGTNRNGKRPHGDGQRQQPSIDLTQLAPETLEALSRLRPTDPEVQKALAGRTERSPSVPRAGGNEPQIDAMHQNRAAFEANRVPAYQSHDIREGNSRSNARHDRGGEEPAEDYTQIIRTPATGLHTQQTAAAPILSVPPQDRYVRVDSRGQPLEHPRHESAPYGYEHDARAGHQEYYLRPEYPPASYGYEPRPETIYVDQYGRPVEVVRVIERHPPRMYDYAPHQPEYYQREDPHARYVYYDQPPHGQPAPQSGYAGPTRVDYGQGAGQPSRYVYDDGRASVPRN